ncbi:MAG: SDR family NAD(P)-dependent oxidoreductase [Gammaproteobacteria bacterium]
MNKHQSSAIVTGGASGLGEATVRLLRAQGMHVVFCDRQTNDALARETGAVFVQGDVTKAEDIEAAIAKANGPAPLRVVVHCAGILGGARISGKEGPHDLASFEKIIHVNLIGTFNVLRLCSHAMSQSTMDNPDGARGVIITTASIAAFEGQIGQAAYSASKAGVVGMTLPAARELARFGIRVVTIAPGLFETPMMGGLSEKAATQLQESVVYPARLGKAAEFAQMALSIIDNPMLNGCTIRLDGAVRLI